MRVYRDIICTILIILLPKFLNAQSVGIQGWMDDEVRGIAGQVLSDKGGAVPYAHIYFIHRNDTIPLACNAIGGFVWESARVPDTLQIKVTAVGYKSFEGTYFPKNQGNRLLIRIQEKFVKLKEVIVTAKKVYMVVKGDTLVYKANSFKSLEGDFIGNLLKKMPGVSFENGSLTVNGEPIYRIYVNGEDFGGKNSVLSNIRADNVKDIEVYDERNKEDQAKGLKYGRRETVMNVITKQKVDRQEWRNGNFLLGSGWDISDDQTSRFKQKWNLKFNYRVPLRIPEGQSKTNPGKRLNLSGEYTNIGSANDEQKSKFTLNYQNRNVNEKITSPNKLYYSTENLFKNNRNYMREIDERFYFPTSDYTSRTYLGQKVGEEKMWQFDSRHHLAYKKIDLLLAFQGKNDEDNRNNRERAETNDTLISAVNMDYRKKNGALVGSASLSIPLKNRIRFHSSFDLEKGKMENLQIDTMIESSRHVHLDQEYDYERMRWSGGIGYSKTFSLFSLGIGYTYTSSMNKEDGESVNELTNQLDTNGTRDYTFYEHKHSLSGDVQFSTRYMYLKGSISVDRLFRNHVERFPNRIQHRDNFLPLSATLYANGKSTPTFNWNFTYRLTTQLPFIPQIRREIETLNPLFLYAGNPNLKPEKQHSWVVFFNALSVSSSAHFSGSMSYDLTTDAISNCEDYYRETTYLQEYDYTVMAGATVTTPRNTKARHRFNVNGLYSKYSGLLESKLEFEGKYFYDKLPSFLQGQAIDRITHRGMFFFRLNTAFSRKVEFCLISRTSLTNTRSDIDKASNILDQGTSLTCRTNLIPQFNISTTFSYDYTKSYATGRENGRPDLKMEIGHQLGRFALLKLEGINLLNRQTGVGFQKTAMYTSRTESARTGRYVMLTFSQKLK